MQYLRCTIHNIDFSHDHKDGYYTDCPLCLQDELQLLKTKLNEMTSQRDALLKAITIKKTIQTLETL